MQVGGSTVVPSYVGARSRVARVTERATDALCDAHVEEFCATDPPTATSLGLDPLRTALERL